MNDITDSETFTDPVTVLEDGDDVEGANTEPTIQALANRTRTLQGVLAEMSARNWSVKTQPETNEWEDICWSPSLGMFVAVSDTGTNRGMYSKDGDKWTSMSPGASSWQGVCWSPALGIFCAVGGSGAVATSTNGTSWTSRTAAEANNWSSVCWAAELSLFVAVASNGTHRVMTSPDGITWTAQTAATVRSWAKVIWCPGLGSGSGTFIASAAVNAADNTMKSSDGITWTTMALAEAVPAIGLAYSYNLRMAIAVGSSSLVGNVFTSTDGATWTQQTVDPSGLNGLYKAAWSDELGVFVAIPRGSSGVAMYSRNGTTWRQASGLGTFQGISVCWGAAAGCFVALADSGTNRILRTW